MKDTGADKGSAGSTVVPAFHALIMGSSRIGGNSSAPSGCAGVGLSLELALSFVGAVLDREWALPGLASPSARFAVKDRSHSGFVAWQG
ncbi:hypothetical protein CEK62_18965 [Alcanivorax sp. N3-2A]|nr:hypothetical protein CEK62_18965 [Alcanivorax sp. N3-2A]